MRSLPFLAAFLALPAAAAAQELPEFRGTGWVNSKDLSLERLKGKVVVLYLYEEG
ncbi:MAG TPA: hypothetical protein VJB14_11570 [Planctomycetota bacterium]|nr:hypothetical protein [Planctomycetota bacterium]